MEWARKGGFSEMFEVSKDGTSHTKLREEKSRQRK